MFVQSNTLSNIYFRNSREDDMTKPANLPAHSAEEALIKDASNGKLDAFNELVVIHQNIAYNHARALLGDPASAEDAVQESFIKAFQNLRDFRGGSFRGWLLKIVTNSSYDILRRSGRHPTQSLFPEDEYGEEIESPVWLIDPSASVQETVEQKEFSTGLYKILDELPAKYRSVLTLIDLYELDYTEAARVLKVPLGTIKSRLARARLQMKNELQDSMQPSTAFCTGNATCASWSGA